MMGLMDSAYLDLQGVVASLADVELLLQLLRLLRDLQLVHQAAFAALVSNGVDTCWQTPQQQLKPLPSRE